MATNDTAGFPTDSTDARFWILMSRTFHASNSRYFASLADTLSANNEAGYRCLAWILLKGWKLPPDFGTAQIMPETSSNALQRQVSMTCYDAFIKEVLCRGYIVPAESLLDNVPLSGKLTDDARHIWNLHPRCKYKENKDRYYATFKETPWLAESAVTYRYEDGEHKMVHNWFREGRIDPAHRDVPPAKTWQRIISITDIVKEYREFVRDNGYSPKWHNTQRDKLLAEMAMYMWPANHRHLPPGTHAMPIIRPFGNARLRAWDRTYVRLSKKGEDAPSVRVIDARVEYVVLPPLYMARATAMSYWGDIFNDMQTGETADLNTSNAEERKDIRAFLDKANTKIVDDFDMEFPATEVTFGLNEPWPEAILEVGQVDPVTGMRNRKRKAVTLEEAARRVATEGALHTNKFGTVDEELEVIRVTKKAKGSKGQAVPTEEVVEEEEPAPVAPGPNLNKTVYAIEEGDLDFMNTSLEDAFDLEDFLLGAPAPNEMHQEENNTNVMPAPFLLEIPVESLGPPLDDSIWTSQLSF